MSEQIRWRVKPRGQRDEEEESPQPVEPVVAQQPIDEQPQQEAPLAANQDDAPPQENEDEAPAVEGSELEADVQELDQPKTGRERGDGPDVKGKRLLGVDPSRMPGAGEGPPQA